MQYVKLLMCSGVKTLRYILVDTMCIWNNGTSNLDKYRPPYTKGDDMSTIQVVPLIFNINTTYGMTIVIYTDRYHNFSLLDIIEGLLDLLSTVAPLPCWLSHHPWLVYQHMFSISAIWKLVWWSPAPIPDTPVCPTSPPTWFQLFPGHLRAKESALWCSKSNPRCCYMHL